MLATLPPSTVNNAPVVFFISERQEMLLQHPLLKLLILKDFRTYILPLTNL